MSDSERENPAGTATDGDSRKGPESPESPDSRDGSAWADRTWADANRSYWDERAPIHSASEFYDLEGFVADPTDTHLRPFEIAEVGDVAGKTLVHPQCHFGLDTFSWARRGARVSGLDFSEPAVATARQVAKRLGVDADFVSGDVYDAVELLGGRNFDVVYTGFGAIGWLPDIGRWAQVMADLTTPGGLFYFAEFHPFHNIMGDDDLVVENPYFHTEPMRWGEAGTYAELGAPTESNVTYEWNHGLGEVVSAIIDAGLVVELLHEHEHILFPRWPFLIHDEAKREYRLPPDKPSIPLMYSIRARKPA